MTLTRKTRPALLTPSMMTPMERARGRFMRAPDHDSGSGGKTLTQADIAKAIADAKAEWDAEKDTELQGLKDKNRELLGKLRSVGDIKPEDLQAAETRAEKAESALAAANKQIGAITKERDKAAKDLETEQGFTQKLLIQDGLKSALLANGVKDEDFIDSLTAKFASSAAVVVEGDVRKALLGDKPLGDAIKEWAGTDAGKKFVSAPNNTGGGAPGGKNNGGTGKTATQADIDAMKPADRSAFFTSGGTIAEAA